MTLNRREILGVAIAGAAGVAIPIKYGIGMLDVEAQSQEHGPVVAEIHRQLKDAFSKLKDGSPEGARQAATTFRLYASTIDDASLRATVRKYRKQVAAGKMNHGQIEKLAKELGVDPSTLPPHEALDPVALQKMAEQIESEGLAPLVRQVADAFDASAKKLEALAKRGGKEVRFQAVALRQPVPDQVYCGNCNDEWEFVERCAFAASVACAAAGALPVLAPVCAAAEAVFIGALGNYGACQLYIALCNAYYN
jgi:hypothetical protein